MSIAPQAGPRRRVHLRRISCEAFERDDGLIDIEGLLIDTKPTPVQLITGKDVPAGEAIHQMRVCLTVDRERRIVTAAVYSEVHPYTECAEVESAYARLVGLRIEPGFTREVKRMFRGAAGCTHISELIPPMATTVFQVLWSDSDFNRAAGPAASLQASPIGGCHGLRLDGQIVKTYFPQPQKDPAP